MKIEWLQCSHFLTISGFTAIFPLPLLLLFGRSPNKEPLGSITPTDMDFFLFHMHFSNYVASLHSIQYQCSDHSQVYVLFTSVFTRCDFDIFNVRERYYWKVKLKTNVCIANKPISNSFRFSRTISCCARCVPFALHNISISHHVSRGTRRSVTP